MLLVGEFGRLVDQSTRDEVVVRVYSRDLSPFNGSQ